VRSLMWFRSDLRVGDNTALLAARDRGRDGVVALFVVSPGEWRLHDVAPARIDLILRTLFELSAALAALNIPLLIETAPEPKDVAAAVLNVAERHKCDAVYFNREYELNESRRDAAATALFEKHGRPVHSFTDQVCFEPGTIRTGEGRYYTVFTPFKRAWIKHWHEREGMIPRARPKAQPRLNIAPGKVPLSVPGFESEIAPGIWPAGETHALARLAKFTVTNIFDYKSARNLPALDGTSALSPYLAIGSISPRQCVAAALAANKAAQSSLDTGNEGVTTWISELIWREFYVHIMAGFPRVCTHRAFLPATERIKWNENEAHLQAWKEGRTGVPIVDAGMRQLRAMGWMHNRVRMIVAMYFSKNLFLDWRMGEKFFMQNLVDGFLASNNGGWQWSASTGTDAAPYFRVFNPVSQSEKCDPTGEYIRKYVPELAAAGDDLHAPWETAPLARGRLNYPDPLVNLSQSRLAAIEAFRGRG